MFKRTTAQSKIAKLRKRYRVVQGGTSSSKTFSIIPMLITYAIDNPNQEISVVSESIPHLRRGAMRDFIKIMDATGNLMQSEWNKSTLTYTFPNGSFIEFFSADQSDKLRGARRDVLFVNEANNVNWDAFHQMAVRTRKFIYIDYNPSAEFWAHTELIGGKDTDFVILTYKDNEALEPSIVAEIEKAKEKAKTSDYWANWWKVYGLGEVGSLQGTVFSDWSIVDKVPSEAKLIGYGLDFGFSVDPSALVEVRKSDKGIYVRELLYEKELTNQDLAQRFRELGLNGEIIADSAEPKSIKEISRQGFNVKGALKGRDSINNSIDILRREHIYVTSDSVNLINELRNYVWDTDKTGAKTGKPIDAFNHCIDAFRYVALNKMMEGSGRYVLR